MKYLFLLPVLGLGACTEFQAAFAPVAAAPAEVAAPAAPTLDPTPPPPPPPAARTVEEFDTTDAADRAAAVAAPVETGAALGTTVASLGSPADPGIWLSTPLVEALAPGRVEWRGNTINLELRPSGGAAGSGSEMSLAAMRLLEVPLTDLPEVTVFRN